MADAVAAGPTVPAALARFSRARRGAVRYYRFASRISTPFFQSGSRLAAGIRDTAFRPVTRVPFVERQMLATLAGLKTGWLAYDDPADLAAACRRWHPA